MKHARADVLLVAQGLADNRSRAQALILAGVVVRCDNETRVDKPGSNLPATVQLRLKTQPLPFVSRGGLKMQAALTHFAIDVTNCTALDVGASTGGFTDCLLQHGAKQVYALDVGYGQLDCRLRDDPRVVVIERCNIRHATHSQIPQLCDLAVIDVSFISLKIVLPATKPFIKPTGRIIALIKPQFEVGAKAIGKGGIVRNEEARTAAVDAIAAAATNVGLHGIQIMPSPITGAKGNIEFLLTGCLA